MKCFGQKKSCLILKICNIYFLSDSLDSYNMSSSERKDPSCSQLMSVYCLDYLSLVVATLCLNDLHILMMKLSSSLVRLLYL